MAQPQPSVKAPVWLIGLTIVTGSAALVFGLLWAASRQAPPAASPAVAPPPTILAQLEQRLNELKAGQAALSQKLDQLAQRPAGTGTRRRPDATPGREARTMTPEELEAALRERLRPGGVGERAFRTTGQIFSQQMTKELKLTPEQQAGLEKLLTEQQTGFTALLQKFTDKQLEIEPLRTAVGQLTDQTGTRFRELLTAEQQQTYDEKFAQQMSRMASGILRERSISVSRGGHGRHGGPEQPGAGTGAPAGSPPPPRPPEKGGPPSPNF